VSGNVGIVSFFATPPSFQIFLIVLQAKLSWIFGQDHAENQGLADGGSFVPQAFSRSSTRLFCV
jgi:hypothetical protein